ncbi:sensor histidine kinase [Fangia hongkongensis]|uniref:sensor histidine kinase n=1 Tax=Fangia hongkongensis TaxID=270495 RepID=UPI000381159C|nr:HAMP domain-containing sensor histidine kinase [Fangia hongkongensis]MBK2125806.1 HAMP domain-containing histidine kinase [Fangia hongkongensis]
MQRKYHSLILLLIFILLSIFSIFYLFYSAFDEIERDVHEELHHKIAWEIAKIIKYGEDEDLKNFLVTFDNKHFSKLKIQRITLNLALSSKPKYTPDYTIKNALDLEEKIVHHDQAEHHFSVFIRNGLWLDIRVTKNYHYFFSTMSAEFAIILLIALLLLIACFLTYRMYRLTHLSRKMLENLGIPNDPALYASILTGPDALFQELKLRIQNLTNTRSELLSSIAHDFKTPLSRMRFRMEKLEADNLPEVNKTIADIDLLSQTISDFLTLATLSKQSDKKVDLNLLLLTLQENYQDQDYPLHYNESKKPVVLHSSVSVLSRIVTNLVDNALRFASNVYLKLEQRKKLIILTVYDDGPGVKPDDLNKLQELGFTRNKAQHKNHYGLGLAIVHELVSLTGGKVIFSNRHPSGFEVNIYWHTK